MACGCPCVVTDVGDSKQVVGDAGMVVPAQNATALANAIDKMLSDTDFRKKLEKQARKRIESYFSVEKLVENSLTQLEQL